MKDEEQEARTFDFDIGAIPADSPHDYNSVAANWSDTYAYLRTFTLRFTPIPLPANPLEIAEQLGEFTMDNGAPRNTRVEVHARTPQDLRAFIPELHHGGSPNPFTPGGFLDWLADVLPALDELNGELQPKRV